MINNSAAVYMINNMGSSHSELGSSIVLDIWEFCISKHTWITAAHVPGVENVVADWESRKAYGDSEWMLNSKELQNCLSQLDFKPDIDLFASRLNAQLPNYRSYRPDPGAKYVNAFTIKWENLQFYCFPPFSCILQVIQKIILEKAQGVLVLPNWATQPWYPLLNRMLIKTPQILLPSKHLLNLPASPDQLHPLHISCVRSQIGKLGLSKSVIDVIMASWRKGTKSQYQTYLSKWFTFCSECEVDSLSALLSTGIDFLASLLDTGYTNSSINTACSALSSLLQMEPPFG